MFVYEVNLEINSSVYDDFVAWLKPHINELLQFKGFVKANLLLDTDSNSTETKKIKVDYYLDSHETYDEYVKVHAPRMRGDGIKLFEGKFTATRRFLQIEESYSA